MSLQKEENMAKEKVKPIELVTKYGQPIRYIDYAGVQEVYDLYADLVGRNKPVYSGRGRGCV